MIKKKREKQPKEKCHDAFPRLSIETASDCKTLPCRYSPAALRETHASMQTSTLYYLREY